MKHALIKNSIAIQFHDFDVAPVIAPSKGVWVEVVEDAYPIVTTTEIAEKHEEYSEGKWVISYTVRDKTPYELWHDKSSAMRFKISLAAINSNAQLQGFVSQLILWWNLMKFTHEVDAEYAYFYCNVILPEHQNIVDAFQGLIEIEDIPTPPEPEP